MWQEFVLPSGLNVMKEQSLAEILFLNVNGIKKKLKISHLQDLVGQELHNKYGFLVEEASFFSYLKP